MIICFLFFSLLIWLIALIGFLIFNQPCMCEINLTWSWCVVIFIYCWIQLTTVLLRILHAHEGEPSVVCLFFFFGFGIKAITNLWVRKYFILFLFLRFYILWDSSCKIDIISIIPRAEKYCFRQGRRAGSVYFLFLLLNWACQ